MPSNPAQNAGSPVLPAQLGFKKTHKRWLTRTAPQNGISFRVNGRHNIYFNRRKINVASPTHSNGEAFCAEVRVTQGFKAGAVGHCAGSTGHAGSFRG